MRELYERLRQDECWLNRGMRQGRRDSPACNALLNASYLVRNAQCPPPGTSASLPLSLLARNWLADGGHTASSVPQKTSTGSRTEPRTGRRSLPPRFCMHASVACPTHRPPGNDRPLQLQAGQNAIQVINKDVLGVTRFRSVRLAEATEVNRNNPIFCGQRGDLALEDGATHRNAMQKNDNGIAVAHRLDVDVAPVRHCDLHVAACFGHSSRPPLRHVHAIEAANAADGNAARNRRIGSHCVLPC